MRPHAAIAVLLLPLSGCWYDVRAPELNETPETWPVDVPLIPGGVCSPDTRTWVACTIDGDTFDVGQCGAELGTRVRMLGIDAPEIAHPDAPADCYGNEAAEELRRVIEGREVLLTFDKECTGLYGRTLAYVWVKVDRESDNIELDDGSIDIDIDYYYSVNHWMLEQGYAYVIPEEQFGAIALQASFEAAEASARSRGVGLWGSCE